MFYDVSCLAGALVKKFDNDQTSIYKGGVNLTSLYPQAVPKTLLLLLPNCYNLVHGIR